ncbi:hypothetical protein F5J12DRAFT_897931 [Pisolithus orientalis]|uniref:uncharacterized protein n=1 Tax=Pisolithus orientalis TaxID=936130 RepID=UPI002224FD24|nr:uncharacterized protein F5J12DRAFT_897931 [Pisolithus orientalis]KAI5989395.1 hypothetical protein F5J12DRAFT_897931 [Pisolithus orientalis]
MPGPPQAPRMSGPSLAGKSTRSGGFSLLEIISDPEAEIKNAGSARTYLDQLYMVQREPATPEHISHVLFYISQTKGVNNMLRSAIRAMAYLVMELALLVIAETVIKAVSSNIENSVVAAISPQIAKILSTADKLEEVNEDATLLNANYTQRMESITNMTNGADTLCLEGEVQNIILDIGMMKMTMEDMKNLLKNYMPPATTHMPYRDVLATTATNSNQILLGKCLSPEYAKAHAAIEERQLLIDLNSNHPTLSDSPSRSSIIEVIKLALEAVEQVDSHDLQLKSITQLHNNGILLELNTQEAMDWIKEPANKATFLVKLGGEVMIKNHHYNIVILFLPISTNTELLDTL